MTGTGVRPGPGSRLRTLARRLVIAAGLAALGWLCAAALGTATASADTPPPTDDLLGVVGATASTVTDTLTGTLGAVTDTVTATVTTATDTATTTTKVVPAKPVVHHHAVVHHPVVPKAAHVTASRHVPVVQHHATAVVRHVVTPVAKARPHVVPAVHRPNAPLRAPPPKTPQAPSPVVPTGWVSSAHSTGSAARHALVPHLVTLAGPSPVAGSGWAAATAVLAARTQGLPASSPD